MTAVYRNKTNESSKSIRYSFLRQGQSQQTEERALQLASDQGNTALGDAIHAQIRLYQSGFLIALQ
jgi:hypothetical protein